MDTRFILPGALAAAFHTFVLFGLTWEHKRPEVIPPPPPPKAERAIIDIDEVAVPAEPTDAVMPQKGPKGNPDEAERLPDPPVGGERPEFPMPPEEESPKSHRTGALPIGPIGTPDGDEFGTVHPNVTLINALDNHPRATAKVSPIYPTGLKSQGIEGSVVVEFIVDETGHVTNPHVIRSTHPGFEDATLHAVANWRFEPGRKGNKIVRYRMALPVDFKLGE